MGVDGENRPWPLRHFLRHLRVTLVGMGLTELNTLSFLDPPALAAVGAPEGLRLANPLSEDLAVMRTTLLPSLLRVLAYNQARNVDDAQIFEARRVYLPKGQGELPDEPYRLGLLLAGRRYDVAWSRGKETVDFFDLKGVVEGLLAAAHAPAIQWRRPDDSGPFMPGVCAEVAVGGRSLGLIGKLRADIAEKFELRGEVFAGELNLDALAAGAQPYERIRPVSKFPPVLRDIAVIADADAPVDEMAAAIAAVNAERIAEVRVFDVYTGQGVPAGKKSVAFSMRYHDIRQSLSDKDADKLTKRILDALQSRFGATLRE
jgi:phenylalanyl-tRNA synthetase beta chain